MEGSSDFNVMVLVGRFPNRIGQEGTRCDLPVELEPGLIDQNGLALGMHVCRVGLGHASRQ